MTFEKELICGCYKIEGRINYCVWHNYHREEVWDIYNNMKEMISNDI